MTTPTPREVLALVDAAREVVRFYGTDRTWSLAYRTLLGSRIDDLNAALTRSDPNSGTCWFCKCVVPVDALIAGYDTFDEQRLACLACNERMQGNWRPDSGAGPDAHPDEPHEFRTTCLRCGERGMLHVSLITDNETVTVARLGPDHDPA